MKVQNFLFIILMIFFSISCKKKKLSPGNKDSANDGTGVSANPARINPETKSIDPAENNSAERLSYLALGDSYTIGQSVAEGERYPVLLAKGLTEAGIQTQDSTIIATIGWTISELKRGIEKDNIEGKD